MRENGVRNDSKWPPLALWPYSAEKIFLIRVCRGLRELVGARPLHLLTQTAPPQRGCFRRKPALQMPLSSTTLPVKMQCRTARRLPGIALIKIVLPLFMRKANAERILNRFTGRRGSGCTPPWRRNGRGCARPSGGWWTGPWERTGLPTGSGGWRCTAAPASPAG